MIYVNVAIDNKSKHTDSLFTYKAQDNVKVGDLVSLPFGVYNKSKEGIVCQITDNVDLPDEKLKTVLDIKEAGFLNEEIVKTAMWMKQRYGIKYYDAFRCFVPRGKPAKEGKEKEPYKDLEVVYSKAKTLTQEQQSALDKISKAIDEGIQKNFLIHGVTSSGKTQVYMEAIEKTIKKGKTAIMLVPEISLTKQVIEIFVSRFGKENIAILHSKLTQRERYDEWKRIKDGKAKIVIGARMGVFAPLSNIGLIVMDEEHEASYKADMTPKYDTVDIALKRLNYYKGILILGSATPSVASYHRAGEGIYELITLKERYNKTPLPEVEIVDMRAELKAGNTTVFSRRLYELMKQSLDHGKQIILLQNRRGYSNFVSCRECGTVMKCEDCGISLTYHKWKDKLVCHYCGKKFPLPKECPECESSYIKHFGIGTEQVEEAVMEYFPDVTVDRLDIDALKTRRDLDRIIGNFKKGKTQILIGTQIVAKGLDFDNVGLVGIIAADVGLNIPDYRSAERTFQLVTQAAGRAGRRGIQGKVIIQTYEPENYALVKAAGHDYEGFFRQEIRLRDYMEYPPFSDLIMVNFTAEDESVAMECSQKCKKYIENILGKESKTRILEPRVSTSFKGKDSVRFYLLIKCTKGERNKYVYYLESFNNIIIKEKIKCNMDLDINPYNAY
jgi:primosomal protein N' (replication factor Y)